MHREIFHLIQTFCNDVGLSWALSIIFIATSRPVGICRANLTLAKLPLPIV
jgi:hypothetical protein